MLRRFVRGAGGWGGDRGPSADVNVAPTREPERLVERPGPALRAAGQLPATAAGTEAKTPA